MQIDCLRGLPCDSLLFVTSIILVTLHDHCHDRQPVLVLPHRLGCGRLGVIPMLHDHLVDDVEDGFIVGTLDTVVLACLLVVASAIVSCITCFAV